jgi:hypothetical protein
MLQRRLAQGAVRDKDSSVVGGLTWTRRLAAIALLEAAYHAATQ